MSTLTTLAASASGLGVAIDFAIGKAGEKRARSWLETWWLKIADIRGTISVEERQNLPFA
jgi:hypothetical protein